MVWEDRSNALFFVQGSTVTMGYMKGLSDFKTLDFFSVMPVLSGQSELCSILFDSYEIRRAQYVKTVSKQHMHFWYTFSKKYLFFVN